MSTILGQAMAGKWKTPRKILCATDLTPVCDRVIDRALQLAREWGASLTVLHVVDDTRLKRKDAASRAHKVETDLTQQVKGHPLASGLNVDAMVNSRYSLQASKSTQPGLILI